MMRVYSILRPLTSPMTAMSSGAQRQTTVYVQESELESSFVLTDLSVAEANPIAWRPVAVGRRL